MKILHTVKHYYHARPKLLAAFVLAVVSFSLLPANQPLVQRLLLGWNILGWLYLFFLWWVLVRTPTQEIASIAREQDESAATVLTLVCLTCLVSILTILFELGTVKHLPQAQQAGHIALTASTLVVSWTLLPTAFSMHYAHMYYQQGAKGHRTLLFPEKPSEPGYWDFIYYSFTIAVAAQTADIATGNTMVRKITTLQAVLSFVFNLAILGLSINVAAGLLS